MGINDVGDEQQMGGPACHSSGGDVAREALLSKTDQQHYRTANLSVRHSTIPDFKKFCEVSGTRRTGMWLCREPVSDRGLDACCSSTGSPLYSPWMGFKRYREPRGTTRKNNNNKNTIM